MPAVPPIDCKSNPPAFTFVQGWQLLSLAVSLFVPKNNKYEHFQYKNNTHIFHLLMIPNTHYSDFFGTSNYIYPAMLIRKVNVANMQHTVNVH